MGIEEKKKKIEFLQKFFLHSFIWNVVLMILATFICVMMRGAQITIIHQLFGADEQTWSKIVLLSLSIWKILIIQFTLVPAIVLFIMSKCRCCNSCSCEAKENKE